MSRPRSVHSSYRESRTSYCRIRRLKTSTKWPWIGKIDLRMRKGKIFLPSGSTTFHNEIRFEVDSPIQFGYYSTMKRRNSLIVKTIRMKYGQDCAKKKKKRKQYMKVYQNRRMWSVIGLTERKLKHWERGTSRKWGTFQYLSQTLRWK